MAYLLNNVNLYDTYEIRGSHALGSNISVQGCFDMPQRIGTTYKDWGDSDGVEPWVGANDIMFAGRDIVFSGFMQGTVSEINTNLETFYTAVDAATGISVFATPYHSASGYVKSVIPQHVHGGCTVKMTFREPAVTLTGSLPATGTGAYTIDSIPFSSFGLYLSKADKLHDLPEGKEQFVTKYGQEGYQIVKRKNKILEMNGFIAGSSLSDFITKIQALYKVFSSSGTRSIVLDTITTVICFATEGFKIDNIYYTNTGVIARFHINLMVKSIAYYEAPSAEYPAILDDGHHWWYDSTDLTTITKDGSDFVSAWNSKLIEGRNLLQATGSRQPLWVTPGTILFDGAGDYMKTAEFTWNQPCMIYMIVKQITWTKYHKLSDGNESYYGALEQNASTPAIRAYAGGYSSENTDLVLNTWGIIRVLFNGASSKLIVDDNTPVTGDFGTRDMGAFTLASRGAGNGDWTNIEVADIICADIADTEENETAIYNFLVSRIPS